MKLAVGIYALIYLGLALVALLSWFIWDKRYRQGHDTRIPEGFERTEEVSVDPINRKKYRVYYNPKTGERFYNEE